MRSQEKPARPASRAMRGAAMIVLAAAMVVTGSDALVGQGRGGPQAGPAGEENLPSAPTAVALPALSEEITGPGPFFDTAPSHEPNRGPAHYGYETKEYFISGTAAGQPYTTRIVVRKPADNARFSGLVLAESMHGSGAAHVFEYTSMYTMDSGHAAVEIVTTPPDQFVGFNRERYGRMRVADDQINEILAQAGALVKSARGPLAGLAVRKMVLAGTSMSAGTLSGYLPAHMVYRTPDMQKIYDGFLPTSRGNDVMEVDVPTVQIPTMHEVIGNITRRQDGDEPGRQFRLYEFSGIAHVDSRANVRLDPTPCAQPLSRFPTQAYMSVGLHHLFQWVDRGVAPPRAARILVDRNVDNDGSIMALDAHGNPLGGIRNPYVDVPAARHIPVNGAKESLPSNPSAYIASRGAAGAALLCRLSAYEEVFSPAELRRMYGTKQNYVRMVESSLDALEREGWSLPAYRELILADANAVAF